MSCDVGEVTERLENELCSTVHSSAHSPTFPSLHLPHSSFSNASVDLPTSQLILQPFRCFTYVTAHSPTLLSLLLRHRLFTYVTWRATHDRGAETVDQNTRYIHKGGPHWILWSAECQDHRQRQHRIKQTKDTHPVQGEKLKFLTHLESNSGCRVGRQGLLPATPWRLTKNTLAIRKLSSFERIRVRNP